MRSFDDGNGCRMPALTLALALLVSTAAAQPAPAPLPPLQRELSPAGDEMRVSRQAPGLQITAAWPVLSGPEPAVAVANQVIAEKVETQIADFEADYLAEGAATAEGDPGLPWTLEIRYGEVFNGPGFWAFPLMLDQFTGGAHGSTTTVALVLRKDSGDLVPPAGLFRPGADWLPVLAEACHGDLAARTDVFEPGDEWLREGTAPEPDNYQALLPRAAGLQVTFQQYQVGPYAIGAFDVLVPWARLTDLLAPDLFGDPPARVLFQ